MCFSNTVWNRGSIRAFLAQSLPQGVHGSVVTTVQSLPRRLTQQLMNDKHMESRVWGPGVWRPQGLSIKYKIEE